MTALLDLLKRFLSTEMRLSMPTAKLVPETPEHWSCPLCTYMNVWSNKLCGMCAFASKSTATTDVHARDE